MRKIILFLSLIIASLPAMAQQGYIPFPTQGAWWQYSMYSASIGARYVGNDQFMVTADKVTIGGKEYNKLMLRNSSDSDNGSQNTQLQPDAVADAPDKLFAGIREEDKRVYIKIDGADELILFDFNLEVGEMMAIATGVYGPNEQAFSKITLIDNVTIGGTVHRRYHLDNGSTVTEGAGASYGLFKTRSVVHAVPSFLCSYDGTNYTYGSSCQYIFPYGTPASAGNIPDAAVAITLYPNPCSEMLHITAPGGTRTAVYDAVGRLVASTADKSLSTAQWNAGLYLVKLYSADGRLMQQEKIMKQ